MSDTELAINDVVSTISVDPEYRITKHVVDEQWDERSRSELLKNPDMISALHVDVKDGTYDKVSPAAMKLKVLDGARKSDIEYYIEAGTNYHNGQKQAQLLADADAAKAVEAQQAIEAAKVANTKRLAQEAAAKKKKAAAPVKRKVTTTDVVDYLNTDGMSDDEFSAFMDKQLK